MGAVEQGEGDATETAEILYELMVEVEWNKRPEWVRNLEGEFQKQGSWISPYRSNPSLGTEKIFKISSTKLPWQLASGKEGKVVAILQESLLEIRSSKDDYGTIVSKCSVNPDTFPWLRKMSWSDDCSLLAIGHTNGDLAVYDLSASLVLKIETSPESLSPTRTGFAFLAFIEPKEYSSHWLCEIMAVNFEGQLFSYLISRSHHHQENHQFNFGKFYTGGVLCGALHPGGNILYLSGLHAEVKGNTSDARKHGVSAWRVLSEYPYYDDVTTMGKDKYNGSLWRFSFTGIQARYITDPVFHLSVCDVGGRLACIHESGQISIWSIPSLRMVRFWPLNIQDDFELGDNNAFLSFNKLHKGVVSSSALRDHPIDLKWWSPELISIVRVSGILTVCSIDLLQNHLGDRPEWFCGFRAPAISDCFNKRILVMECEASIGHKSTEDGDSIAEQDSIGQTELESLPGYLDKVTDVARYICYWVTDLESFRPASRKPLVVQKTYRLILLKSATPEELFEIKIEAEEYGDALLLATTYDLNTDKVYQKQWHKSPITNITIEDYLWKIKKRSWVLYECVERVPEEVGVCSILLTYGLRGTHLREFLSIGKGKDDGVFHRISSDEEEEANNVDQIQIGDLEQLSLDQRDLLKYRQQLLQYIDYLAIYEGLLETESSFDAKFYEDFRKQSPVVAAVKFSQNCNFDALTAIFTYKGDATLPHRLVILTYIPETSSPYEYSHLLPECDLSGHVMHWNQKSLRDIDWSETIYFRPYLEDNSEEIQSLYEDEKWILEVNSSAPTSADLSHWYLSRARHIEERSGSITNATDLLRLGMQRNVPGLTEMFNDLETLETLVYEVQADQSLHLDQLQQMTDRQKVELMMKSIDENNMVRGTKHWLMPFLKSCESKRPGSSWPLFEDYMVSLAKTDLRLVSQIFEESKQGVTEKIIGDVEKLMTLAIRCIYEMESTTELIYAFKIMESLPQRGFGAGGDAINQLHSEVDDLELELIAADELLTWKLPVPVSTLHKLKKDEEEAKKLFSRLIKTVSESSMSMTDETWTELLETMLKIQIEVLHVLKDTDVVTILVEHLLRSNNMDDITLAVKFLDGEINCQYKLSKSISKEQKEKLILEVVRDYFNKSRDYDDDGIELAKYCLHFLDQSSPLVVQEFDLISALGILGQHNVKILPMKVRYNEDKAELIQECLSNKTSSYKRIQPLLKLACFLRLYYEDKKLLESTVYYLCAQYALKVKDYKKCCDYCQKLVANSYCDAWKMCYQLGSCEELEDSALKENLLSFALAYCPNEKMLDVLISKRKVEVSVLLQQVKLNSFEEDTEPPSDDTSSVSAMSPVSLLPGKMPMDLDAVVSATKDTTKVLFDLFSDQDIVKKSVSWITDSLQHNQSAEQNQLSDVCPRDHSIPSYPEFYCSLPCGDHLNSNLFSRYQGYGSVRGDYPRFEILNGMLRSSIHDSRDSGSCTKTDEILLNLFKETLCEDEMLSLCYLLALSDPKIALELLKYIPKTEFTLLLCMYFGAIILSSQYFDEVKSPAHAFHFEPLKLITHTYDYIRDSNEERDDCDIASFFMTSFRKLQDVQQAKMLISLGQGIEVSRFAEETEYRHDTIVGLAMSDDESLMDIVLDLANKYGVTSLELYLAHTVHLLRDSKLTAETIRERLKNKDLLDKLQRSPQVLQTKMQTEVLPLLSGCDYDRLQCYYSVLLDCCPDCVQESIHIENLEKLQFMDLGVDYKKMMDSLEACREVLHDVLDDSNVATLAEVVESLHSSSDSVYGLWALITFMEESKSSAEKSMEHFVDKDAILSDLCPEEYHLFLEKAVMSSTSVETISRDIRRDILQKAIQFTKHQSRNIERWKQVGSNISCWMDILNKLDSNEVKHHALDSPQIQTTISAIEKSCGKENAIVAVLIKALLDEVPVEVILKLFRLFCESSSVSSVLLQATVDLLQSASKQWEHKSNQLKILLSHFLDLNTDEALLGALLQEVESIICDEQLELRNRIVVLEVVEKVLQRKMGVPYFTFLFTRAILQPHGLDVSKDDFVTADGRNIFLSGVITSSVTSSLLYDVLHVLRHWPQDKVTIRLWEMCIMKCFEVGADDDYCKLVESVVWLEKRQLLSLEVVERIFSEGELKLGPRERLKIGLHSTEPSLQRRCVSDMLALEKVDSDLCDADIVDRILELDLAPSLVNSRFYSYILDHVLQQNSSSQIKHLARLLYNSGFEYEAGSLMLVSMGVPRGLLTFSSSVTSVKKLLEIS